MSIVAEGKKRHTKPKRVAEGIDRMPSGRLRIRWYEGRQNGKERIRMRTLPDRTTVADAKKARQLELDRASRQRRNGGGEGTVGEFAERWLRDYPRPSETTNIHNEGAIRPFVRDFGPRKPETISRAEARLWASGGIAPAHLIRDAKNWEGVIENDDGELVVPSHRYNVGAVRAMFTDLVDDEQHQLQQNPFAGLRLKQERGRSDIVVLTRPELERLETIARRKVGSTFAAMVRFAAWTGLRPAELYALRWHDIDPGEWVVKVRRQYRSKIKDPAQRETAYLKTSRATKRFIRNVPLLKPAREALESLPTPMNPTDVIFPSLSGEQMTARTHSYYWAKVRDPFWETLDEERKCPYCARGREHDEHEAESIPEDFDFYELRHWYGTYMAKLPGVTPMHVAKLMGHVDGGKLAMERYFHFEEEEAISAVLRGFDLREAEDAEEKARRAAE